MATRGKAAPKTTPLTASNLPPVYNNLMLDLETYGQRPGCPILSIGAVFFDRRSGKLGAEFHQIITMDSCRKLKMKEDGATIDWWNKQSKEARKTLDIALGTTVPKKKADKPIALPDALAKFSAFCQNATDGTRKLEVWGNGADFDQPIIGAAYHLCKQELPWQFWNSRCFRTLKNIWPHIPEPAFEGTAHNALADARHQAQWALHIFQTHDSVALF